MSADPLNVFMQVLSVSSFILFGIAYAESSVKGAIHNPYVPLYYSTAIILAIVFLGSLIVIKIHPDLVYDLTYVGGKRFSGLFGEPAQMGAAAGLALGVASLGVRKKWLKLFVIAVAAPCLALTLSRTFWIATVFAGLVTAWHYYPRLRNIAAAIFVAGALAFAIVFLLNIKIDTQEGSKLARVDSFSTMSGRTEIWKRAYEAFLRSPLFGHGFTKGSDATFGTHHAQGATIVKSVSTSSGGETLHSGYIQSLVDSGLFGFIAYITFIATSILRLLKYDVDREHATEFYILNYLWVGNFAENTIYSGAELTGGIFWITAVLSLSIMPIHIDVKTARNTRVMKL